MTIMLKSLKIYLIILPFIWSGNRPQTPFKMSALSIHGATTMARPKKVIEVPGETKAEDTTLENSLAGNAADLPAITKPANTAAELHAATAGATIIGVDPGQGDSTAALVLDAGIAARNEALSGVNLAGFEIIAKFEAYGFVDEIGHPLTNCLDFLDLVKQATTPVATVATLRGRSAAMVVNEDGALHAAPGKPVLTEHGWHVPE